MPGPLVFFDLEDWQAEYLKQHLSDLPIECHATPFDRELARDAEGVSVFVYSRITAEDLAELPHLRWVATRSTGFDHLDLPAARGRGVQVSNVPHYGENTVAEHTFALILALSRKVHQAILRTQRHDFNAAGLRGFDLKDRTIGVVGCGNIGLHVVRIARGFGMRVLGFDARPHPLLAEVLGFEYVPLERLLAEAEIVSLHVPNLPQTFHLLSAERLALMRKGSILVNTARGEVVDTQALVEALDSGQIAGAGLDVLEGENQLREEQQHLQQASTDQLRLAVLNYNLLGRDNVVITPHIGFYSEEAETRILETTVANIRGFLAGQPVHLVS